jgi:signal peptidase II
MSWKKWPWFLLSLVVLLLDQASKHWALMALMPYQPKPILPSLNMTLAFNFGASFSFLSTGGHWTRWLFVAISLGMSIFFAVWLLRMPANQRLQSFGISLILGGALGNLYDRLILGYVVDFIEVYYKSFHWPVFNIADSAICLGAFCLVLCLGSSKK